MRVCNLCEDNSTKYSLKLQTDFYTLRLKCTTFTVISQEKIKFKPHLQLCFISIKYLHYLFLDLVLNNNLEFTVARIVEITVRREDRYAETLAVDTQQELQSLVDTRSD